MFEKITIMRYNDARPIEILEHMVDNSRGVEIEVIGWFVHDDDMWTCKEHLGKCHFGSFSSRECLNCLIYLFSRYQKPTEHSSDLIVFWMMFREFCNDGIVRIEVSEYL